MFGNAESKPLVEVCIKRGEYGSNTPADDYDGNIRYVRITDITEEGNLNNVIVSPRKIEEKYMLLSGDLLFARTGNTVGKTYLHKSGKMIFAGYLIRYRLNKELMLPQFAFAYAHTNQYYNWVDKTKKVGAQPNISAVQYDSMPIPVPLRGDQMKFVTIAEQADKSKFGGFKSQFIEMFGSKCRTDAIGNLLKITSGGTPSSKKQEYYEGGTIPWLTSGEVSQGIISSTKSFITEAGLNNSSAKWVSKGSVVVAMYGATAGKTGILDIDTTTNQAVCSLLPSDNFTSIYLYYAVKSNEKWMMDQATGGAQPNISQTVIKKMVIPVPSIEQQHQFASIAQQADKSKYVLLKLICTINNPDKFIN